MRYKKFAKIQSITFISIKKLRKKKFLMPVFLFDKWEKRFRLWN